MAAEIQSKLGVDSELIQDRGGVFDVHVDGKLIFSKHAEGDRFPEHDEIIDAINNLGINN